MDQDQEEFEENKFEEGEEEENPPQHDPPPSSKIYLRNPHEGKAPLILR